MCRASVWVPCIRSNRSQWHGPAGACWRHWPINQHHREHIRREMLEREVSCQEQVRGEVFDSHQWHSSVWWWWHHAWSASSVSQMIHGRCSRSLAFHRPRDTIINQWINFFYMFVNMISPGFCTVQSIDISPLLEHGWSLLCNLFFILFLSLFFIFY